VSYFSAAALVAMLLLSVVGVVVSIFAM